VKYVITGGLGFVGKNLVEKLKKENKVQVIDRNSSYYENGHENVEVVHRDIRKMSDMTHICKDADVFIHLAALSGVNWSVETPHKSFDSNVVGTFNCLEMSRLYGIKKFIFASSGGTVLGEREEPLNEEMIPNPMSPYGAFKLCGEAMCKSYYHTFGMDTVILRFSNVYGPYSDNKTWNLVPSLIMNAIKDEVTYIYGDGESVRDFINVHNLTDAIMVASKQDGIGGEIFHLSSGRGYSVNEIISTMDTISFSKLGRGVKVEYKDKRSGEVRSAISDNSKAKKVLGLKQDDSIFPGLSDMFDWYMENYNG